MKEIVILSGKGGVGKSSIAASLGVILARQYKMILVDTDVDAPNLDLVLGATLSNSEEIAASSKAFIDYERCIGCMMCKDVCRFASIIGSYQPVIIPYSCEGCGACTIICPEEAIEIREVVNGQLNIFDAENMLLIAGELPIGGTSSGHKEQWLMLGRLYWLTRLLKRHWRYKNLLSLLLRESASCLEKHRVSSEQVLMDGVLME